MQYWQRKLQRSVTEIRTSPMGRPWPSVMILLFVDSFADALAMGQTWFAHAPLSVRWRSYDPHLLYIYWASKWGLQVPLRCFAMAWNCGAKKPLLVAVGAITRRRRRESKAGDGHSRSEWLDSRRWPARR